ncbi:hypothetical protein IEO21_09337 [Rhodonia placenta]|uniref:Uncharacterized protein n=1 Tax=Rhodonia placenta TaxID=104341 RepID=A0A8H7TYB9_9APHY|nr:hypothetical protein IEO21_09337 [Postia placenta]
MRGVNGLKAVKEPLLEPPLLLLPSSATLAHAHDNHDVPLALLTPSPTALGPAGEVPRVCAWPQLHGVHGVQGNMRGLGEDLCGLFLGSKFRHVGPQALHTPECDCPLILMQPMMATINKNEQKPEHVGVLEDEIAAEAIKDNLEITDAIQQREDLNELLAECLEEDFPEDDESQLAQDAAKIAQANITKQTRTGHMCIIKAFILFTWKQVGATWDPKAVTSQTPYEIRNFILQKCGERMKGYEGQKFSTAVSTRAALTLWYRSVRPYESVAEWRVDADGNCYGLPTRFRAVSKFMIGLEKTKAKAGEVSQSAWALSLEDILRLHDHCIAHTDLQPTEQRWGVMRYTAYLFAWLMLLCIEKALTLQFESVDIVPGERCYVDVQLGVRKSAQTGTNHVWRLWANETNLKICPMCALIRLSAMYGKDVQPLGPLFRKVSVHDIGYSQPCLDQGPARSWLQVMDLVWHTLIPTGRVPVPCQAA